MSLETDESREGFLFSFQVQRNHAHLIARKLHATSPAAIDTGTHTHKLTQMHVEACTNKHTYTLIHILTYPPSVICWIVVARTEVLLGLSTCAVKLYLGCQVRKREANCKRKIVSTLYPQPIHHCLIPSQSYQDARRKQEKERYE